jgi:Uma2 family endonuclease
MATETVTSDPLQMLPPELHPKVDHLVTEDDTPVDNVFSEKQQRLLTEPLFSSWAAAGQRRSFVAMANVGLFYAIRQPPFVPDVLLSLDVELPADVRIKAHRCYFVWEYDKAPDVIIEVVSNREGGEDSEKLAGYARVHVPYYVIFDPDGLLGAEVLRAYRLEGLHFQRMDEPVWFPDVGLGLRLWHGRYEDLEAAWLRWVDAEGRWIPSGSERADIEQKRADAEQKRADAEQRRADAEQRRAERLAEQLRRLGVEPQEP